MKIPVVAITLCAQNVLWTFDGRLFSHLDVEETSNRLPWDVSAHWARFVLIFSDYRIYEKESIKKAVLEIFKNTFFTEHLQTTASEVFNAAVAKASMQCPHSSISTKWNYHFLKKWFTKNFKIGELLFGWQLFWKPILFL